jgi:predicted SAM-dependent methyltransferase
MLTSGLCDRLHLGCGKNILSNWLNTDVNPWTPPHLQIDARSSLPFGDAVFQYIFHEHLIEHLTYSEALLFTKECWRVLKPGGVIRIATPDLQFLMDLLNETKSTVQQRYLDWAISQFAPHAKGSRECFAINNFFRAWGHQFIYDAPSLCTLLSNCGFTNIVRCQVGESIWNALVGIEGHGKSIPEEFNRLETMVFEASKPHAHHQAS